MNVFLFCFVLFFCLYRFFFPGSGSASISTLESKIDSLIAAQQGISCFFIQAVHGNLFTRSGFLAFPWRNSSCPNVEFPLELSVL